MLTPGEVLDGRYEILELLARGGMGAVYRARRILLGDDVAVKVLSTPDDASLRERFLRESRAAAVEQIHSPSSELRTWRIVMTRRRSSARKRCSSGTRFGTLIVVVGKRSRFGLSIGLS